ncbi:MAG: CvpA family protein [Helicobacteraceae bacterium]|jgi:membrane protein required for colicin V production|nr:CvpA family protein [Helicobacteraceae bacterium]
MSYHWLDIVVLVLIALLGIQGILRGAIRELFGLLGIGLGIFLGTRFASEVGKWASDRSFQFSSETATKLAGFLLIFLIVWAICFVIGLWLSKRLRKKESATRLVVIWLDRLFGFLICGGKIYIILATIVFAVSQINAVAKWADENLGSSFMYKPLKATGGFLAKLDPSKAVEETQKKVEEITRTAVEKVKTVDSGFPDANATALEALENNATRALVEIKQAIAENNESDAATQTIAAETTEAQSKTVDNNATQTIADNGAPIAPQNAKTENNESEDKQNAK